MRAIRYNQNQGAQMKQKVYRSQSAMRAIRYNQWKELEDAHMEPWSQSAMRAIRYNLSDSVVPRAYAPAGRNPLCVQ